MRKFAAIIAVIVCSSFPLYAYRIMSYNVENLFDVQADSLHDDYEYTPEGIRHWNTVRYARKRERIARTIVNVGEWEGVAIVGLCEVENEQCLRDLCRYNLRNLPYSYVHYESADVRGIDVALLYRRDLYRVHSSCAIRVAVSSTERPTRDILYVVGSTPQGDTLHTFVCHLPSQLGGATSMLLRERVKHLLEEHVDSILHAQPNAQVVIMGDMNSAPVDDICGMTNMMCPIEQRGGGTYKHKGMWSCIDQFYVSSSLLGEAQARVYDAPWLLVADEAYVGYKPSRTYEGYRYNAEGYSDHLPIVLDLPEVTEPNMAHIPMESIVQDIYSQLTEEDIDVNYSFESLQEDLLALREQPLPLNSSDYDGLHAIPFLTEEQVSNILLMVRDEQLHSLYELQLVRGMKDYEVRNLLPFVCVGTEPEEPIYWREMFYHGHHDASVRLDVRNIEAFEGTDPLYVQAKYAFSSGQRLRAGLTLQRPAGGGVADLRYGGFVQVSDMGMLKRMVGGCYQASFGQGLVTNTFFRMGKSSQVMQIGALREGLSKVSSASEERYQGVGATLRLSKAVEASAWYSVDNTNVWHHAVGVNVRANMKQFRIGITMMEHLYSDSLQVRNNYYNGSYFRGRQQFVGGVNMRYAFRWVNLFAEGAVAENRKWGGALVAGVRMSPWADVGIVALYRYYSPTFDNKYGYAFSESSRIGDEHGGYVGAEYKLGRYWRLSAYADLFAFKGPKYGIRASGTMGYDVRGRVEYMRGAHSAGVTIRSRMKASGGQHSVHIEYTYEQGGWRVRTIGDANMCMQASQASWDDVLVGKKVSPTYGVSVSEDVAYAFRRVPIVCMVRMEAFDVRNWNNRIYLYENDVLYAFSVPSVYGIGGRWYVNMRYRCNEHLSFYVKVSETLYQSDWAAAHSRPMSKTDIHALVKVRF